MAKTENCKKCGEKGYEGIFSAVSWTCPKCKTQNKWKEKKNGKTEKNKVQSIENDNA